MSYRERFDEILSNGSISASEKKEQLMRLRTEILMKSEDKDEIDESEFYDYKKEESAEREKPEDSERQLSIEELKTMRDSIRDYMDSISAEGAGAADDPDGSDDSEHSIGEKVLSLHR